MRGEIEMTREEEFTTEQPVCALRVWVGLLRLKEQTRMYLLFAPATLALVFIGLIRLREQFGSTR